MQCEKNNLILHPMNAKYVHLIYILLLLSGLLAGACHDDEVALRMPGMPGDTLARTLIVYMAAENNLDSYLRTDSMEIAWGIDSIPADTRVVLFIDDAKSSRLCVGMKGIPLQVAKTYEGNLCSTDSLTMAEVLEDIVRTYPARTYGMVLCSHASGWLFDDPVSKANAPRRSFGIDNGQRSASSNYGRKMNIPVMAGVLSGIPHLDFLMFDACFMQCVEVAYELRHCADYIIASPAEIPGDGAPYTEMMRLLCTIPSDAEAIARRYVDYYVNGPGGITYGGAELSVVRTDQLERLAKVTAPLMQHLLADRAELSTDGVQHYYPDLYSSLYTAFFDLRHLLYTHLAPEAFAHWDEVFCRAVPVRAFSSTWYSAYGNRGTQMALIDPEHTGGISVYVPLNAHARSGWIEDYHRLQWYEDIGLQTTNW